MSQSARDNFHVYILASGRNGTLYVGMTNNLNRRHFEHLHARSDSFTGKYNIKLLVYAEAHQYADVAIAREKALKKFKRNWKIELIEEANPDWYDLSSNYF